MDAHPTSPDCFIARFKADLEIVFTNRGSQKGELRGERLKTALLTQQYACLRDLLMAQHLGPMDTALRYALAPVRMNYLAEDDAAWPLTAAERAHVVRDMARIVVGTSTLDRLLEVDRAEGLPHPDASNAPPRIDGAGYVLV
jgi:hypothetical protein